MKKKEGSKFKISSFIERNFKTCMLAIIMLMVASNTNAQEIEITGVITDEHSEVLPGVSIAIKGTTIGAITNLDGKFTIKTNPGDVLTISYVGYLSTEIEVSNQTELNVQLKPDLLDLDEVIVIGYGTQKKKLNTGSTVNVKGEDLQKLNTVSAMEALKSNSPGVSITSLNGIPGKGSKVIIRGTGTMGNPAPLYVVDGVTVGNIDFLSPSDIQSVDILKDAASTAIYGALAANGVVLVTTRKGNSQQKPTVSYDGYYGWQQMTKRPGVVDAQTYMELYEEAYAYEDQEVDWERFVGDDWEEYRNGTNPGTNWVDKVYNENAPTQSHALNISGGNETSHYALGGSYVKQVGILCDPSISTYERYNARINTDHILYQHKGLNILKVGQTFNYSKSERPNLADGNIYWNDFRAAMVTHPLLPMWADENTDEKYLPYHEPLAWASGTGNPVASINYNKTNQENEHHNAVGNIYAEIQPLKGLVFRSSYGFNTSNGSSRSYVPVYELSDLNFRIKDNVRQSMYKNYTQTITNTLTYNFNIQDIHNFTAMVGHEAVKTTRQLNLSVSRDSTSYSTWERAYIDNTPPFFDNTDTEIGGQDKFGYARLSYFGRISYDFKETLLATFVYRKDASNNLAPDNLWGSFFSVSLGYILSNHDFIKNIPGLNYLKVRGGWGQNGNERINPFQYASTLKDDRLYFYGNDANAGTVATYPDLIPNTGIGWETSEQTSIGFDANFLNNRLQFAFDWYNKQTKNWLVMVPKPLSNGAGEAVENGGAVSNKGVELALNWSDNIGEFGYNIGVNWAYNKNEVTELRNEGGEFPGEKNILEQGLDHVNQVKIGYPIGYFYGLETDGILQNEEEVAAYVIPDSTDKNGDPVPVFNKMIPGDFRYVDQNGDGVINDEDKVMIGDPTPDHTFGINLGADYKGAYFSLTANAAIGHQIAMNYAGFQEYDLGRWHGEGSSSTQPRLHKTMANRNYTEVSDYYIHDADFLRISNITVGYDFNRLIKNSPLGQLRLYLTGQNLFTFTKYPGMTPEVGYGGNVDWGSGIDLGLYPQSKTYMVGLNVTF